MSVGGAVARALGGDALLVRRAGAVLVRGGGGAAERDREAVRRRVQLGVRGRGSAHAPDVLPVDVMALLAVEGGEGDGGAESGESDD